MSFLKKRAAFSRNSISAGTKACCPFTKIMCNALKNRGNRDALAQFEVTFQLFELLHQSIIYYNY